MRSFRRKEFVDEPQLVDSFSADNQRTCRQGTFGTWLFDKLQNQEDSDPKNLEVRARNLEGSGKQAASKLKESTWTGHSRSICHGFEKSWFLC
jgi:hypothetical protein